MTQGGRAQTQEPEATYALSRIVLSSDRTPKVSPAEMKAPLKMTCSFKVLCSAADSRGQAPASCDLTKTLLGFLCAALDKHFTWLSVILTLHWFLVQGRTRQHFHSAGGKTETRHLFLGSSGLRARPEPDFRPASRRGSQQDGASCVGRGG